MTVSFERGFEGWITKAMLGLSMHQKRPTRRGRFEAAGDHTLVFVPSNLVNVNPSSGSR
jgi:hypothetical protein